ncbi:transposase, partial [Chloroflexota bacterium]
QMYLMPVSLQDWLSEGHLAWFMLDAVEAIDLSQFYLKYRTDGWGRAAYDPQMMVSLLLYAYCLGVRSSRQTEQACGVDVAFRVITGNLGLPPKKEPGSCRIELAGV